MYYRLNVIKITVPPLRERKEDLPVLVRGLVKKLNFQLGMKVTGVTPEFVSLLMDYDWPGNIRELQNVLERSMNMAWGDTLEPSHLGWFIDSRAMKSNGRGKIGLAPGNLKEKKMMTEKQAIEEVLQLCHGNRAQAARLLNISRTMLYKKLRKHGIKM